MIDLDAIEKRYPIEREYANLTDQELQALITELRRARELIEAVEEIARARGDSDPTSRWLRAALQLEAPK